MSPHRDEVRADAREARALGAKNCQRSEPMPELAR